MSTPDQPDSPPLTRRQLREIRNTASTPIITPEALAEAAAAAPADAPAAVAPLARAAEPVVISDAPPAAEDVDLDAPAFTRRGARQQERLRTASVAIISEADSSSSESNERDDTESGPDLSPARDEPREDEVVELVEVHEGEAEHNADSAPVDAARVDAAPDDDHDLAEDDANAAEDAFAPRPVIAPTLGSGLLSGQGIEVELPASFDQLLSRGSTATGALVASNALILSQTPDTGSFTSPVAATGEILVTGTFNLPDRFGSTGTVPGTADGKDIDAILVDGELPASSSPTPIAASAAISTIKSAEDIIRPPAPEKGGRLMLALVITAGALALALTGVLIVALVTGAYS